MVVEYSWFKMSSSQSSTKGHTNGVSESTPDYVVPLLINGKEIITETKFDVVNPTTDKLACKGSSASKKNAIEAVEAAQAAFTAWSKSKPSFRRGIFLKAADILASREDEYMEYIMTQTGASEYTARLNVISSVEQLQDIASRIMNINGTIPVCGEEGRSALGFKEPYGVVFGIAPWYFTGTNAEKSGR